MYNNFHFINKKNFNISVVKRFDPNESKQETIDVVNCYWLNRSFVCRETKHIVWSEAFDDYIDVYFEYPNLVPKDKENHMELNFFINNTPYVDIKVEDKKATAFDLNKSIYIKDNNYNFNLSFSIFNGSGDLFGHVHRGNRAFKKTRKDELAPDWKISIRTIDRTSNFIIKTRIGYLNNN